MNSDIKLITLHQLEGELRMVEQTIEKLTKKKIQILMNIHNIKKENNGSNTSTTKIDR